MAFGIGPLAATPAAHADGLDVIFDPIINSIDHAVTGLDALSGLDLGANLDLGGLGGGALDQWLTLPTDSVAGVGAVTDAASGVSAATDAAAGAGPGVRPRLSRHRRRTPRRHSTNCSLSLYIPRSRTGSTARWANPSTTQSTKTSVNT